MFFCSLVIASTIVCLGLKGITIAPGIVAPVWVLGPRCLRERGHNLRRVLGACREDRKDGIHTFRTKLSNRELSDAVVQFG